MSDDEALTKRAIEEILREASENKTQVNKRLMENKINPLVKPNKNFLGRTVKSVMAHNRRHSERIMRNCRVKLKEMDMAKERAKHEKQRRVETYKEERREHRHKYKKKIKKRKTYKRKRSSSEERIEDNKNFQHEYDGYHAESYADENKNYADVYYDLAQAALASHAYHQVGKWLCYQTLLSDTHTRKPQFKHKKIETPSISLISSDSDDDPFVMTDDIVDLTHVEDNVSYNNHIEKVLTESTCVDYIDLSSGTESDSDINVSSAVECQLLELPNNNILNVNNSSDEDD